MADEAKALIVRHCQIAISPANREVAVVRLSADKKGPHLDFVANAQTLEQLAATLAKAAKDIRGRVN